MAFITIYFSILSNIFITIRAGRQNFKSYLTDWTGQNHTIGSVLSRHSTWTHTVG